ncbi:zinc finger protein 91-like isoform X2 [Symsagittifera roscoffensis]|uniref:zinc finger protein 91-like isoform X2 n=1 Tax=Symsagittifera roscoffensis TaxID=84072 RepID=UPI00307C5CCA
MELEVGEETIYSLPMDETYFCCEECGTIFETLEHIRYHIEKEHKIGEVIVGSQVDISSDALYYSMESDQSAIPLPSSKISDLANVYREYQSCVGNDDSSLVKTNIGDRRTQPIATEQCISVVALPVQSLPVIQSTDIEEVVSSIAANTMNGHDGSSITQRGGTTSVEEIVNSSRCTDTQMSCLNERDAELRHKCPDCRHSFSDEMELKRHCEGEHGVSYLICQLCGKCFSSFELLTTHLVSFHRKRDKTWSKREIMSSGLAKEAKMFPCSKCGNLCASKQQLQQHSNCHSEESEEQITSANGVSQARTKPQLFLCNLCIPRVREFSNRTSLNRHMQTIHSVTEESHKLQPNSNAAVVAQGFTVSEGLELNSASCLNESMTECVASLSNPNGEEDERTSVISDSDSHFLLNSLIVKSSPTHYSCAACLKRFQDLAILRKHITNKHLGGSNIRADTDDQRPTTSSYSNVVYLDNSVASFQQSQLRTTSSLIFDGSSVLSSTAPRAEAIPTQYPPSSEPVGSSLCDGSHAGNGLSSGVVSWSNVDAAQFSLQFDDNNQLYLQGDEAGLREVITTDTDFMEVGQEVVLSSDSYNEGLHASSSPLVNTEQFNHSATTGSFLPQTYSQRDDSMHMLTDGQASLAASRKTKRYQCPDCGEAFKKFVRLQSHIQIKHPHMFAAFEESTARILNEGQSESVLQGGTSGVDSLEPLSDAIIDENGLHAGEFYQMEVISSGQLGQTVLKGQGGMGEGLSMNSSGRQIGVGVGMGPSRKDVNNFAVSSERPYLCQECGKAYKMRSHLSQHIRYHTGEKPFKCDICGQNFHLSGDRNRHVIKMHSDYRPHKCLYCPKGFVDRYALNNHMKFHMAQHAHKCEYCEEKFPSKSLMKQHRVSHFF